MRIGRLSMRSRKLVRRLSTITAMKMIEKMWDKQDTKKMGKLDKKQVEAFLKDLIKPSGS